MEVLQEISTIAGYGITIMTLMALLIKPLREIISKVLFKSRKEVEREKQLTELIEVIGKCNGNVEALRLELEKKIAKQDEENEKLEDALKCTLRNTITHLYYKYTEAGEIPPLEKENVSFLYSAYERLNGNTYVHECYEQLMELPVKK